MAALLACWGLFPIVMVALVAGCGLLAERLAGVTMPGALIAPTGIAVVIVIAGFFTLSAATAALATPAVVVAAVAGYAVARDRRRLTRGLASPPAAAALAVFLTYGAPVLLSGKATFAGYIKLDDTATWLAITDRAMSHARDLGGLAPSTYEATLANYLGTGYPIGSFLPWGVGHVLVRQDLLWIFQPYEAFIAAMLSLAGFALVRPLIRSRWLAAGVAFVGAEAALLYGYSLWGGVKEMMAALLIALVCALLAWSLQDERALARPVPLTVASAAVLVSLSVGGGAWIAVALLGALVVLIRRARAVREWIGPAARFVVWGAVLALPAFISASTFVKGVAGLEAKNAAAAGASSALGNLLRPLSTWQAAGIWPVGDFRATPSSTFTTGILIEVVLVAAVCALVAALRARTWGVPLYVATSVAGCAAIAYYGAPWVDAKALATTSPAILLAGACGTAVLIERTLGGPRPLRIAGVAAGVALVAGVAWSNALAYHEVNLGPRGALRDLEHIGHRFAHQGPALITDYQAYGARHFLRALDAEGASELRRRVIPTRSSPSGVPKGGFADIDEFTDAALAPYRTLVLRRSPTGSRPASAFAPVWSGRWYQVWQRNPKAPPAVEHFPLGNSVDPGAIARCSDVERLAREAGPGGRLATVVRAPVAAVALSSTTHPAGWALAVGNGLLPSSKGTVRGKVSVAVPGRYGVWIGGSFRSRLAASVDGRAAGSARHQLNYAGAYTQLGELELTAGAHRFTLDYAGPDLAPGSAGTPYPMGPLVLAPVAQVPSVEYVSGAHARSLCGKRLDWIEAIRRQ